jgi:YVTN family beta-propeller protein
MMKRGLILALALAGLGTASAVALSRLDDDQRRALYLWINDTTRSLGLGVRDRDLRHMQQMTRLQDVSNVSCRDCHGISLETLPWAQPRPRHASPDDLLVSPDGSRLYVATADRDEVLEINTSSRRVTRRAEVNGAPSRLAIDPSRQRLYVTCRLQDSVAAIDLSSFEETHRAFVGRGPVGIAFAPLPNEPRLIVANAASDDISLLDPETLEEEVRLLSGREPYAIACSPDGSQAIVACRLADIPEIDKPPQSELTLVDVRRQRVFQRHALDSAHLSEATAFIPDQPWTLTPLVRVRNLVPITQVARGWVMSGGIALASPGREGAVIQLPIDEANAYFADPAGCVVDARGRRAYLASGGGDVVTVIDLQHLLQWIDAAPAEALPGAIQNLELSAEYVVARIPTGRNPQQLALSPTGDTLYVAERLDDSVLLVDTETLQPKGRIVLDDGGEDDPIRRGERVFTTAAKTFQGQFSCRSCHPSGHVDGLTYDFDGDGIGDNMLDNRSLQGLAGSWPFKWNGKNPSLKVQCGPRFAKVLMRTEPFTDDQLRDLSAFLESMPPARTVHASEEGRPLTPAQERGRAIFFATRTPDGLEIPRERQCSSCHMPPLYTNRMKSSVGTQAGSDVSDEFDTPHLLGIAASAPYLHDGRAKTLEELWTLYQTNDLHGVSSYMNKQQLNDLIEFLKTL